MRRLIVLVGIIAPLIALSAVDRTATSAQSGPGPVQSSQQLALPASAFPSGYEGDAGEAWSPSRADGSSFSHLHVRSYTALGMLGAWYQYYATTIFLPPSDGVVVVAPVEAVYLGTYYPDAASAANAFADAAANPSVANSTSCSYGTRCVTFPVSLQFNGVSYSGLARLVQDGNAVAEIRVDSVDAAVAQISAATFAANLNGVSQGFVQAVSSLEPTNTPTNTPVPSTATPTNTPIPPTATPTSTPTSTPSNTATSTPEPVLFVQVKLGHRTVRVGKKQSVSVTTLPEAQVSVVVAFPDGARKRHSGRADESGAYVWSFKQPAGHATASRHTARVTVTVSYGTETPLKATRSYAIT